jgi:hypothetical protein
MWALVVWRSNLKIRVRRDDDSVGDSVCILSLREFREVRGANALRCLHYNLLSAEER